MGIKISNIDCKMSSSLKENLENEISMHHTLNAEIQKESVSSNLCLKQDTQRHCSLILGMLEVLKPFPCRNAAPPSGVKEGDAISYS